MELTPNDIRNSEFKGAMRGYSKNQVDEFVEQVATALEVSKQENLKLSMELDSIKSQLAGLKQFEETIKNAAIDARRNADMTVANAKQEAELILARAKGEAQKALEDNTSRLSDLDEKIHQLELVKKSYINKLRTLIASHMDLVEEIDIPELPKLDKTDFSPTKNEPARIEITNSSEVDSDQRETIADLPSNKTDDKTNKAPAAIDPKPKPKPAKAVVEEPKPEPAKTETAKPAEVKVDEPKAKTADIPKSTPVDPELAAALEQYNPANAAETMVGDGHAPQLGEVIETKARAEDIPAGFVAKEGDEVGNVSSNAPALDLDSDVSKSDKERFTPSLDEVVAKLDELDPATKH